MKIFKKYTIIMMAVSILMTGILGCQKNDENYFGIPPIGILALLAVADANDKAANAPKVVSTIPVDAATNVIINRAISVSFSKPMDSKTLTTSTFTVVNTTLGGTAVTGTVSIVETTATFKPQSNLAINTKFTATITTGAKSTSGYALQADKVWTFETGSTTALGPDPVILGLADDFVILSKSGVTNVPTSVITGNVGTSPITGASIDLTCAEVTGTIYSVDATGPLPCRVTDPTTLTTAVSNMETAYTDGAGRAATVNELGAGNIGGQTLVAGTYKWSSAVTIPTDITISGGADDVWIFVIAQNLDVSSAVVINLTGGAQAKNIYWQVAGIVTLNTTSQFKGTILGQVAINLLTGATLNGRTLSQTQVTLDKNTATKP